jgi:hypothetical protein
MPHDSDMELLVPLLLLVLIGALAQAGADSRDLDSRRHPADW